MYNIIINLIDEMLYFVITIIDGIYRERWHLFTYNVKFYIFLDKNISNFQTVSLYKFTLGFHKFRIQLFLRFRGNIYFLIRYSLSCPI